MDHCPATKRPLEATLGRGKMLQKWNKMPKSAASCFSSCPSQLCQIGVSLTERGPLSRPRLQCSQRPDCQIFIAHFSCVFENGLCCLGLGVVIRLIMREARTLVWCEYNVSFRDCSDISSRSPMSPGSQEWPFFFATTRRIYTPKIGWSVDGPVLAL